MSEHRPVDSGLALPVIFQETERLVRLKDPELRLRKSVEVPGFYVLERRSTRTKPPDTTAIGLTDVKVATRDGYLFITHVHPLYLGEPQRLCDDLFGSGDLHAQGMTAERYFNAIVDDMDTRRARRRAARLDDFRAFYREGFDLLDRVGDKHSHAERTRLSNAGGEERFNITDRRRVRLDDLEASSTGESPVQELSDEHPPGTPGHRQVGELHDRPDA